MKQARSRGYIITTKKVLSLEEQKQLKRVCDRPYKFVEVNRDGLLIMLTLETGARASEMLNMKVKDFDPRAHSVFIRGLKGSNDRELPLRPRRSLELLRLILDSQKANEWMDLDQEKLIFDICYHRLYQIWRFYTPNPDKGFKSLRHSFAVNLYQKTKDLKLVQLALGHRNIENTMVYVDFLYSQEYMRKLMHG